MFLISDFSDFSNNREILVAEEFDKYRGKLVREDFIVEKIFVNLGDAQTRRRLFSCKKGAEGFPESEGIFSQYVCDYIYVYVYSCLCPSWKIFQYLILKRPTFVPFKKYNFFESSYHRHLFNNQTFDSSKCLTLLKATK